MSEIKIEKGVPIPDAKGGRPCKYPWHQMEVGDSFFVPGVTVRRFGGPMISGQGTGFKFTRRAVEGGVRVWRVA